MVQLIYKARLVAKGFTQTYDIDYQEIVAPIAKMNSICVIFSCAANLEWDLQQLDVKNTFLNGDLVEEMYIDIPLGFPSSTTKGKVCKLKKSFMDWSILLECGLIDFIRQWSSLGTSRVIQITRYPSNKGVVRSQFLYYMLMT